MTNPIILQLTSIRGLKLECPHCAEEFPIKRGKLFNMYAAYPAAVQKILRERLVSANELVTELKDRKRKLKEDKEKKPVKIAVSAQASNFGQISEQILPAFVTFPYRQDECRILFKPIDYIVFTNLSQDGHVESIKFVDVKTGKSQLDTRQRQIRNCVSEGKIEHRVI